MINSEDGYCPVCNEGDVISTGYLDKIQFVKCCRCGERYAFKIDNVIIEELPFKIDDVFMGPPD